MPVLPDANQAALGQSTIHCHCNNSHSLGVTRENTCFGRIDRIQWACIGAGRPRLARQAAWPCRSHPRLAGTSRPGQTDGISTGVGMLDTVLARACALCGLLDRTSVAWGREVAVQLN